MRLRYDYSKPPTPEQTCGLSVFREYDGQPRKYWSVEVRFVRRLTASEVRRLAAYLAADMDLDGVHVGEDGVVSDHWPHDWASDWTNVPLAQALKRLGVPCKVRAAPSGRDCLGRGACPSGLCHDVACCPEPRCELGSCGGCDPVFTEQDWQHLDFRAPSAPSAKGRFMAAESTERG